MKKILFVLPFFCSGFLLAQADTSPKLQNFNKVSLASVYDGDTFKVYLSCKYAVFCKAIPVRVRGVDCPEIRGGTKESKEAAKLAKKFTKEFLKSGKILLRNCSRDKYFRLLCDVKVNGQDLATQLIEHSHAVPYSGGTKS
ncbi:MAG: thermonuclease family protein [Elusimicrobiaceae bacterium]|nr:thermonuclease family protein [Elusimicrobiaceae bacterium]